MKRRKGSQIKRAMRVKLEAVTWEGIQSFDSTKNCQIARVCAE